MPKRFKIKLSSIQLCRSKKQTLANLFSPMSTILSLDDSYPIVPEPPPTTPNHLNHNNSMAKIVPISDTKCDLSCDFVCPLATKNDGVEGVTVVKRSENPHEDFKWSMLEMILENEMYGVKDLEYLLQRFLSLNSVQYHGDIVEAFAEVWGDLFGETV